MCRNSEYCSIFTTVLFFFKIIYFYYVFLWKCKTTQRRTIIFFRCTKPITIRIYYGHMINNVSTVLLMKFFCSAFLHKHKACIYYIKKSNIFHWNSIYKHWSGVLYSRLYRFYFFTKKTFRYLLFCKYWYIPLLFDILFVCIYLCNVTYWKKDVEN